MVLHPCLPGTLVPRSELINLQASSVYLDGINTLKDPELFADKIRDEVRARRSSAERNPSFVASVVGST